MAIIKRRIMSRSHLLTLMFGDIDQKNEMIDHPSMKQISGDMAAHLLADGVTVKVYDDWNMGGTVVEYNEIALPCRPSR